jgi:hypothetical protein
MLRVDLWYRLGRHGRILGSGQVRGPDQGAAPVRISALIESRHTT